jgi:hypothetical protein
MALTGPLHQASRQTLIAQRSDEGQYVLVTE